MDIGKAQKSLVSTLRNDIACGMGFLAPGSRVVTARHCVNHTLETVEKLVRVSHFLNPEASADMVVEWFDKTYRFDVAVLKPKPGTEEAFADFVKQLTAAPVQFSPPEWDKELTVHFRRHDAGWETGTARFILDDDGMGVKAEPDAVEIKSDPVIPVHKGTSGTPIFDDTGAVVGVMRESAADADPYPGLEEGDGNTPPAFAPLTYSLADHKHLFDHEAHE